MGWELTDDVDTFLAAAGPLLEAAPAQNTVLLTVAEQLRRHGVGESGDGGPLFGWWSDTGDGVDGAVRAAFLQTPPWPAATSSLAADQADALVDVVLAAGRTLPGIGGDVASARAVGRAWTARTGRPTVVQREERLFRLAALRAPDPVAPGSAGPATDPERDLVLAWLTAFCVEAGSPVGVSAEEVARRVADRSMWLWRLAEGPVSLAGVTPVVARMRRIGPVYTPPEQRRHGYGAAITSAVTRVAQQDGAVEVVLSTDLANPTSNALYQRLGYVPVGDRLLLRFPDG